MTRANPLQTGTTFRLDFMTAPNGSVAVFAKDELGRVDAAPFAQRFQLGTTPSLPAGISLADAGGLAVAAWPIPDNPALIDEDSWFHGLTGPSFPLEISPVTGGLIR